MDPFKILFVDDEEINLLNFRMIFQDRYEIITALSGEEGLRCFQKTKDIGLVISDQRMPGISGTDMLGKIYDIDPDPIRVLLTAHTQVEDVLDAINLGRIYQYILKPWDTNELNGTIDRARDLYQLKKENVSLTDELAEQNRTLALTNQKLLIVNDVLKRDVQRRKKLEEQFRLSEERLGDLSAMLITAQDDERRRLSMELHDEFGQSLAALKLQLRAMENTLYNSEGCQKDVIIEGLRELRQYVNLQIGNVRNLSRELWPMMVDDLGVDAAFENLISGFLGYSDIELDINMEPVGQFFSVQEQRHLYRLLQESLNNVIKHAHAKIIEVRARQVGDEIVLAVHDNGCGFDVDAVSKSTGKTRGIGLQAIAERVKLLCGKMEINSKPGMGTAIIFTLNKDRNCS